MVTMALKSTKRILRAIFLFFLITFVFHIAVFLMPPWSNYGIPLFGKDSFVHMYFESLYNFFTDAGHLVDRKSGLLLSVIIKHKILKTLILTVGASILSAIIGTILGTLAALYQNKWPDKLIRFISVISMSLPLFFLSLLLIIVFTKYLGILPSGGSDHAKSYILPILTLAIPVIGYLSRIARGAMIDALAEEHIKTAQAQGISKFTIVSKLALKNASIPILTGTGLKVNEVFASTLIVETLFSISGFGRMLFDAINTRDMTILLYSVFPLAFVVLIINLSIDIFTYVLDPRIKEN